MDVGRRSKGCEVDLGRANAYRRCCLAAAHGQVGYISGKEAAKAFSKAGWSAIGQVGSHLVMSKPGHRANLSIPQHKELSVGTLRALIRAAGMSVDDFLQLM